MWVQFGYRLDWPGLLDDSLPPLGVGHVGPRLVGTVVNVRGKSFGSPLYDGELTGDRRSGYGGTVVRRTVTFDPDRFHGRAPVPVAVLDRLSVDLPPPLGE